MNMETIQTLIQLNNRFYRENHETFSQSRSSAWEGWERVVGHLAPGRLLDVACGNLRFERFLMQCAGAGTFSFTCIDTCRELVENSEDISFIERDVIAGLIADQALPGGFDAVVSFGFMHHVPSAALRAKLMRQLLESVVPGAVVAVSFWQFMRDERLAGKARETTARGCAELGLTLDEGDYLLGWNGVPGTYRYCHSFDDSEIDNLTAGCAGTAKLVDSYRADGRTGELNGYRVFRRL